MAVSASGRTHSLFLDPLGSVWSCGSNQNGELGFSLLRKSTVYLQSVHSTNTHQKINNLPPIISISAGDCFSLFVDANGSVWSCGHNGKGQLGLGDKYDRNIPEQITNLPKIKSSIALGNSSIYLDCEGSVWTCGYNEKGQLGLGDTKNRNKAEKIQGLPAIKSMAGGRYHSLFLDEQGNVWVCGANQNGELGMGHTTQINSPQKNNNLSGIVAVGGGENYSVFLDNAGNIYTCGWNKYGQLGLGDTEDRHTPQKVNNIPPMYIVPCCNTADGYLQIVDEAGRVWSCGKNGYGQLRLGHSHQTLTFQKIENQAADNKEALQEAIDTGNLDCVKELVAKHGAEIFSAYTKSDYKRKETVIHRAINQNQTEVALYILKQQKSLVRVMVKHQDFRGETPLHRCGWCGRSKIAEELIKLGGEVNTPNSLGLTALHLAAKRGIFYTASLLLFFTILFFGINKLANFLEFLNFILNKKFTPNSRFLSFFSIVNS